MFARKTLIALICTFSVYAMADQMQSAYDKAASQAVSMTNQIYHGSAFNSLDANDYTTDPNALNNVQNQGEALYSDPDNLEKKAQQSRAKDKNALAMVEGFVEHKVTIDPDNEALKQATNVMGDAYEISHGI